MSTEMETMFDTRTKPWHGLGENVKAAPDSGAALKLAGMRALPLCREIHGRAGKATEELNRRKLSDWQGYEYIDTLFPLAAGKERGLSLLLFKDARVEGQRVAKQDVNDGL